MFDPIIVAVVMFVFVAGVVGLVAYMFRDTGNAKASDRLDQLVGKRRKESQEEILLKQGFREGDKQTLLDSITPNVPTLQKVFEQADCHIKPSALFGIGLGLAAAGMAATWLLTGALWLAPLTGVVFFTIPFIWLFNKRRLRLKAFGAQLPDALELVARALRAGHSLGAGMHVVAEEMPAPICEEFGRVYEEQNLGIPLDEAMRSMCDRVPNLDLRFFVTSVSIQRQTGGDLAEILDKIGYVIRERFRILGQVKALTAEGRLSGVVLIALPFLLFFIVLYIQPTYVQELWLHPILRLFAIGALIMQILGAFIIKKIVDIKV